MWNPYIATQTQGSTRTSTDVPKPKQDSIAAYESESRGEAKKARVDYRIVLILLAALVYNALLAIANAHVTAMSLTQAGSSR